MRIAQQMEALARRAQDALCAAVSALDPTPFREDVWQRPGGGGGRTRVLQGGTTFEKAGVSLAEVHGRLSSEAARAMGGGQALTSEADLDFYAVGVSTVMHPHNPFAPTAHANFRYFQRGLLEAPSAWWFGGGADLTPSYLFDDDARHFHATLKAACDAHDAGFYPRFKTWCDDYFHIVHRGERRGIGGIFFDDLHDRTPEALLAFVSDCAAALAPAYLPLVERRRHTPFDEGHKAWQQLRRGRYVEFNLVYDRGTAFGLRTGGRIESILMSLPLTARWEYDHAPAPGSEEARLLEVLRAPRDWVD